MKYFFFIFCFSFPLLVYSQANRNDTIRTERHPTDTLSSIQPQSELQIVSKIELENAKFTPLKLNPTRAGLYSAVLPGLGQYYNKKYWKIPIVWGAIGTGVGFILWNDKVYRKYRNAFVSELNGVPHEFSHYNIPNLKQALGREQDRWKRNRDYAIAITGLLYILNIVDAVVDAHLYEGRNDPDLAFKPAVILDEFGAQSAVPGLSLHYRF